MNGEGSQLAFAAAALLEVSAADFEAWERSAAPLAAEAALGPTTPAPSWGCR
jgi:hypothetical protein